VTNNRQTTKRQITETCTDPTLLGVIVSLFNQIISVWLIPGTSFSSRLERRRILLVVVAVLGELVVDVFVSVEFKISRTKLDL
jgi:predicted MFS family arabinose efflux permease